MARCPRCGRRGRAGHDRCPPRETSEIQAGEPPHIDGFRPIRILGRGGFASVWAAERVDDGRAVALKISAPEPLARAQVEHEAAVLEKLGPPSVPRLLARGAAADGSAYVALELISGTSLAARMEAVHSTLPLAEAAPLLLALLDSLAVLHAAKVAHLDLKPENVLVRVDPLRAVLIDLGLSRDGARRAPELPEGAGTPEYMSPEQCAAAPAGPRADVYAAGVILFEMLAGRPPFVGAAAEVKQAHIARRPPPVSALVPEASAVEPLVSRCLAKDPDDRFAGAAEMARAMRATLDAAARPAGKGVIVLAPPPPRARAVRQQIAAVFLASSSPPHAVKMAVEGLGGQLAHAGRGRFVAVFDAVSGDAPIRRAAAAAAGLVGRSLSKRALVDVLSASAMPGRAGGAPRYLSAAFTDGERYPRDNDAEGVLVTPSARDGLDRNTATRATVRDGIFVLEQAERSPDATMISGFDRAFVGRDALLADLIAQAARSSRGDPTVELVIAEAGQGKSRLAAALLDRLRQVLPHAALVEVRAPEPLAGGAEATLRLLLAAALGISREEKNAGVCRAAVDRLLGPDQADELWPAIALGLRLLGPEAPELRNLMAAPGAIRSLSLRALGELMRARAASAPLCVVLDDAHLADDTALDALEYATLAEAGAPVWICALARPTLEASRRGLGERAKKRRVHRMGSLEASSAEDLCRRLLEPAENVPGAAVRGIAERTQGVPLLIVEVVRALKREGIVRRREGPGARWFVATDALDRLPDVPSMDWLAQREIAALPEGVAAHARLAAVVDAEIFHGDLEGILGELDHAGEGARYPLDAAVGIRRLLDAGVLVASRRGAVRFRHALLRDAVARTVPEAERKAASAAAARHFRMPSSAPEERRLPLLARHAAESGATAEAASLYLALARRAQERHAYVDAEATYTRALSLIAAGEARGQLQAFTGRATMRYRMGRSEDALADFAKARELAASLGDLQAQAELLLDEATALDWANDARASARRVEQARAILDGMRDVPKATHARYLVASGRSLYRVGKHAEAGEALERAAAAAEALGAEGYEVLVISLILLETILAELGRVDDAARAAERAIALAEERGDLLHLGSALNNRRMLQIAQGNLKAAIADQLRFVRIGRELGMTLAEYYSEWNLGEMLCQAGDAQGAEPHVRRAIEIERAHPEVGTRPIAVLLQARLHAWLGDAASARAALEEVRSLERGADERGQSSGVLTASEQVLADTVEATTRAAEPAEIELLVERSTRDSVEQEPLEVLDLCARAALRAGRRVEALALWDRADALAARLPNLFAKRFAAGRALAELATPPSRAS